MAKLVAYLSYPDARQAIQWLQALGFQTVTEQPGQDGSVLHAELRLGEAVVMLASFDAGYETPPLRGRSTGTGRYLVVDDVSSVHRRALAAGGHEVFAPEQTEWGTWRSRVLDPGGWEWSFGTYQPGESW